ncbi:MAG TPA: glycosyl hydrolase family 18 protein [Longimicrobiaceae bacterium]|nr:glycosyl hydrolase family 18 protein [Longimicrobiaceae bacterium]
MSTTARSVNAWISVDEDHPDGTSYTSPESCYQAMVRYGVYRSLDILCICWVHTLPTGAHTVPQGDGRTITVGLGLGGHHPGGLTSQDYMDWVIRDARKVNPGIKILATLGFEGQEIERIFNPDPDTWQQAADAFAANLMAYVERYRLDGFDVDWEQGLASDTGPAKLALVLNAVRAVFDAQPRKYLLTLSPDQPDHLEPAAVNRTCDFVNLQIYSGHTCPEDFVSAGIDQRLLAYGAKFEAVDEGTPYYQTAQEAASFDWGDGCQKTRREYDVITQWRINSGNFQFEQAQQMILYQLVHGVPRPGFDDAPIAGAAGNPPITQLLVRAGDVLDAVQTLSTGTWEGMPMPYELPQHGGDGGSPHTVSIPAGDALVKISGYTGGWFGWDCVLQITLTTRKGVMFGPFGSMANSYDATPFTCAAPPGQSIVALSGSIVHVPRASGGPTDVVASLAATYA